MANAERLIELFNEAKARPAGPERERFLAEACPGELALKEQVISLLQAHEGAGEFLKNTVISPTVLVTERPGDKIGRYKLLQVIGEGGCGVVYMAEQSEPVRRKVAIKVIKLGMDTKQVVARFEAERQALALMDHPNIAKVFDAGATDTGRPYFVMELVRGIKITDYCDRNHLSTRERLDLFIQVCQAIQHAHQKGIIHRDIKPSNILVAQHDTVAVPKVIDFGIAKATSDQPLTDKTLFTAFEQFMGTPAYMSPEQAQLSGLDIDTRTDIYSLGVLLYELLTGQPPFDPEELMKSGLEAMRKTIREEEPVKPSTRLTMELVARQRVAAGVAPAVEGGVSPPGRDVENRESSPRRAPSPPGGTPGSTAGGTPAATARRLPPEQKELIALVRGDLDWIVMKCLEKDRTRRYETANGLAADLKRHLSNELIMARPPSTVYRLQKAFRRNKLAFTAAAAIGMILIIGVMVSTGLAIWANRERADAIHARKEVQAKAEAEAEAKNKARTQQKRAEGALAQIQMQRVEDFFAADDSVRAVAYLASVLTSDPSNRVAAERLLSALTLRDFSLPLTEPLRHQGGVASAQFSPDGQRVVTASADKTARVWNAQAGKSLTEPLRHKRAVWSAQFSPDGQRVVVTPFEDKTAQVWDAQTGKPLADPLRHEGSVYSARFSPDGLRIVTASGDKTARVWDAQTGKPLTESLRHENLVGSAQFSPDGQRVVTASADKTARVWDAQTGKPLTEPLGHEDIVQFAQFSPDGQRVVTASEDKTARVWNAQTGKPLTEPLRHESVVWSVQFSPDGRRVVTASGDKTARVWDAQTGKPLTEPLRHEGWVRSAQFSPDGLRVVTASEDKTARVWDVQTGKPLTEPLWHEGWVRSAQFSPDGLRVVTASGDTTARVWDAQSGQLLTEPLRHEGWVHSAQFSADGLWVVTASADKTARVWEMPFGSLPAPPWLPQLAVTVAGKRLTRDAVLELVAAEEFLKLKAQLSMAPATNFYTRWAKWFCADRATRTISPLSSITVPEYVQRRIEENREESLSEALLLSPTNALAWARLGIVISQRKGTNDFSRNAEAEWCAKRALSLDPRNEEVMKAVDNIRRIHGPH